MHSKKDFYRLIAAKHEIDMYLRSMVWYYTKKTTGTAKRCNSIDVVGYPTDDFIILRLDGDKLNEITIPMNYIHERDNTVHATMLSVADVYDGPIAGIAEYNGEKVWYLWHKNAPLSELRIFKLYKLSDEEIAYEESDHQEFRDYTKNEVVATLDETFINRAYQDKKVDNDE